MKHEEARNLLDELIDEALDQDQAASVREHIKDCDECRSEARSIKILSLALGRLPSEDLRDDERREIVAASRAAASRRPSARMPAMGWLAAAAALIVILAVGVPLLLSSPDKESGQTGAGSVQSEKAGTADESSGAAAPAMGSGPLPVVVVKGGSYSDTAQIDKAVRSNPGSSAFLGYYRAGDVGALQRQFQEYVKERAPTTDGRSPAECMNLVFRSVPRPILPAYVEGASFEGQDAWVLAFAFTDNTSADAQLSEVLIYVLARSDCNFLSTASYR